MQQIDPAPSLFPAGPISCSPVAIDALHEAGVYGFLLVYRHMTGDWGDDEELAAANRAALKDDGSVVSRYRLAGGIELVVTTMYVRTAAMRQTDICLVEEVEDGQTAEADEFDLLAAEAATVEEYSDI